MGVMLKCTTLQRVFLVFFCFYVYQRPTSALYRLYCGRVPRLTSDNFSAATHETGTGYQDSCLSRSHYTDTDPNSGGRNHFLPGRVIRTADLSIPGRRLYHLSQFAPPPLPHITRGRSLTILSS